VYVNPCAAGVGMGVLLLPRNGSISPNRAVSSLDLVYAPPSTEASATTTNGSDGDAPPLRAVVDPSGVPISFRPVSEFEEEERVTR
jgi:hypothetical protein